MTRNQGNGRKKTIVKREGTAGGRQLRTLRERAGRTQLDVELDANLGSGYLQRVESGKVARPERETLERILAALNVRYTETRGVLEMFGYLVATPLPSDDDVGWAKAACRKELDEVIFPAYLLDCAHRLLAWNDLMAALFAALIGGKGTTALERVSMLRVLFDPQYGFARRLHNPEAFYPMTLRALRHEMALYRQEAWYRAMIDGLARDVPRFRQYWQAVDHEQYGFAAAARLLVPMEFDVPGTGLLKFRLTSESFTQDSRFRLLFYLPADVATMETCAGWGKKRTKD